MDEAKKEGGRARLENDTFTKRNELGGNVVQRDEHSKSSKLENLDRASKDVARRRIQGELEIYLSSTTQERQEVLKKIDKEILEAIKDRYGEYLPEERLKDAYGHPVKFQGHKEYLDGVKEKYPFLKLPKDKIITGDLRPEGPYVDYEAESFSKTIAHERIHQLRSHELRKHLGSKLDEGFTEYLAREVTGSKLLIDEGNGYPKEQGIAELIKERVGDEVMREAYFKGNVEKLRSSLDAQLGNGTTDKVAVLTRLEMYNQAVKVLRRDL
ncbi:MAG: hypothetical protein Q6359_02120 [Candidatus Brocadiales bacterium]|nr:hypothetical protein [Candidatus Brocadiales bacterium]